MKRQSSYYKRRSTQGVQIHPLVESESNDVGMDNAISESSSYPILKSGEMLDKLHLIYNIQTAADKWNEYANTKRKMKRKEVDDISTYGRSDNIRLLAEMGIAELGSDEESDLQPKGGAESSSKRYTDRLHNRALLQYVSKLARSRMEDDVIDLYFLESMIDGGADISCRDRYGQTVLHEAARAWHVDVADFMIRKGAVVNVADKYGRTPLHVAAATNYSDMVKFLLDKGANIEARTGGIGIVKENQTACHYAAKNDATEALQALYDAGCNIGAQDFKQRTPLHVAAEWGCRETAARLLLLGAKASNQDKSGMTTIVLMILNMAPVAKVALDQFVVTDKANHRQYYHLYQLEHMNKHKHDKSIQTSTYRTAIQAVVQIRSLDLIMHPVFEELFRIKWNIFGWHKIWWTIFIDFIFTSVWTAILVMYSSRRIGYKYPFDIPRLTLLSIGVVIMVYQVYKEIYELVLSRKVYTNYLRLRREDLEQDAKLVHPRWVREEDCIQNQMRNLKYHRTPYFRDGWNFIDWITYLALIVNICSIGIYYAENSSSARHTTISIMSITIILVWFRFLKDFRAFRFIGPFIIMLGVITTDIVKFSFIYLTFYIPYSFAFYAVFGGSVDGYRNINQVLFSMLRITVVDDYGYDDLYSYNPVMCNLLCGTFILFSAIISLNLFIAVLSDTFQRVYDKSLANAAMQQARVILAIEEGLSHKSKHKVESYIEQHSPTEQSYHADMTDEGDEALKKVTVEIKEQLDSLQEMLSSTMPTSGGSVKESNVEDVVREIKEVNSKITNSVEQFNEQRKDIKEMKEMLSKLVGSASRDVVIERPSYARPPTGETRATEDSRSAGSALQLPVKVRRRSRSGVDTDGDGRTSTDRSRRVDADRGSSTDHPSLFTRMSDGGDTMDRNYGLRTITDMFPRETGKH